MSIKKYYGWDKYTEEGIVELKKIKESKTLLGKDDVIDLIDRYIELYRNPEFTNSEITAKDLYGNLEKEPEFIRDKARHTVNKFRDVINYFYNNGEGIHSEFEIYFIAEKGDYRLGIRKKDLIKKNVYSKAQLQLMDLSNIKTFSEKIGNSILNFLRIYLDALLFPTNLSARALETAKFKWDTIFLFLFTSFLTFIIIRQYLEIISFKVSTDELIPVHIKPSLLSLIDDSFKKIYNLKSFDSIFSIFKYPLIFVFIPWVIANSIFKEKIKLPVFANFQFYFLLSWIPIYVWFGCLYLMKALYNKSNFLLIAIFFISTIVFFINYFRGLCKLLNTSWKKGILFFIISLVLPLIISHFIEN